MLHGMDDEGGGPISGTSSRASVETGLPDTKPTLSSMTVKVSIQVERVAIVSNGGVSRGSCAQPPP
jgi:hypothetical protein